MKTMSKEQLLALLDDYFEQVVHSGFGDTPYLIASDNIYGVLKELAIPTELPGFGGTWLVVNNWVLNKGIPSEDKLARFPPVPFPPNTIRFCGYDNDSGHDWQREVAVCL